MQELSYITVVLHSGKYVIIKTHKTRQLLQQAVLSEWLNYYCNIKTAQK
jgi:hypothetical protein